MFHQLHKECMEDSSVGLEEWYFASNGHEMCDHKEERQQMEEQQADVQDLRPWMRDPSCIYSTSVWVS